MLNQRYYTLLGLHRHLEGWMGRCRTIGKSVSYNIDSVLLPLHSYLISVRREVPLSLFFFSSLSLPPPPLSYPKSYCIALRYVQETYKGKFKIQCCWENEWLIGPDMKPLSVLYFLVTEKSRELNNITVAKFPFLCSYLCEKVSWDLYLLWKTEIELVLNHISS